MEILDIQNELIKKCSTILRVVSDVVITIPKIDSIFIGKTIDETKSLKAIYLAKYDKCIKPIEGRASSKFRKMVYINLLRDFLKSN